MRGLVSRRTSVATLWVLAVGALATAVTGCGVLPGTHTSSTSPDQQARAYVRHAFNIETDDHLYLAVGDAPAEELLALAPDMDWCRKIIWSPDSRTVGFLINDQQLALYDVPSREHLAMVDLIGDDGPWNRFEARDVSIDNDRRSVTYERYERPVARRERRDGSSYEYPVVWDAAGDQVIRAGNSHGRATAAISNKRLKLAIAWPETAAGKVAWVEMKATDGRAVTVKLPAARGRVVELPAFTDGPLASIVVSAQGPRAVLQNVAITNETVPVQLTMN